MYAILKLSSFRFTSNRGYKTVLFLKLEQICLIYVEQQKDLLCYPEMYKGLLQSLKQLDKSLLAEPGGGPVVQAL